MGSTSDTPVTKTGKILAGNMQVFVPYYDFDSNSSYDYQYSMEIKSVKYKDTAGNQYQINGADEKVTSNNRVVNSFSKDLTGNISGRVLLYSGNTHDSEESSAVLGATIRPMFQIGIVDGPYNGGSTRYITWNSSYVTFKNRITRYNTNTFGFPGATFNSVIYKYGILKSNPDKGLLSITEINASKSDDFDWYNSTSEALNHGKIKAIFIDDPVPTVLGIVRGFNIDFEIDNNVNNVGKVVAFYQEFSVYDDAERTNERKFYATTKFQEAVYNADGTLRSLSTPRTIGSSALILGARATSLISVSDLDTTDNKKQSYDEQDGEINVTIKPTLSHVKVK